MSIFSNFSSEKRHRDLQERLEKLERDFKALQLEWENSYDKLRSMMGRIAKRAEKLHDEAEADGRLAPRSEAQRAVGDGRTSTHTLLNEHQRDVQQQILRRRAGG